MNNEIILFEDQDIRLEVNIKDETVWLSLEQMAKLFGRDRTAITRHINNVFKDNELDKNEVCAKFAHTTRVLQRSDFKTLNNSLFYKVFILSIFCYFYVV